MVAKDFKEGDLVWAKMKGYPHWPSKISKQPLVDKSPNTKKPQQYVYFFGSKNYAWILEEYISHHSEEQLLLGKQAKTKAKDYWSAVEEIEMLAKKKPSLIPKIEKEVPSKPLPVPSIIKKKIDKPQKVKRESDLKEQKKSVRRKLDEVEYPSPPSKEQKLDDDAYMPLLASFSSSIGNRVAVIRPSESKVSVPSSGLLKRREHYERPSTPPLDISQISETLVKKNINPTQQKIGFLGLGLIGRGIVKNLLNSRHNVTVWNSTPEECEDFEKAGAEVGRTPADVVQNCDITFCCVSDTDAAKSLVFGNCGVLLGLEKAKIGTKGYVEMSSIDPEASQEIAEAITDKGGRYLEAPVSGSRQLAEEGSLLILGAGDRELFNLCESCFFAFSKNAYYLSCMVGCGYKMNIILNMLMGTTFAALAEAMALVERCNLSAENFLEILDLGPFSCPLIMEKGQAMLRRSFVTNIALDHQQRDLNMAVALGNTSRQPLFVSTAANEVFKRAQLLGYSDYDVSAILLGAKY